MSGKMYRLAIVGAGSLKGKELKEVLEQRSFPAVDIKLLDDDELLGQLESVGEEATFIQSVQPEQFENVDFAFFASEEGFTRKHWTVARNAGCSIVDLSYALENEASIPVRSPWVEQELRQGAGASVEDLEATSAVTAHPASVVLALLLLRARLAGAVRGAAVTAFEPASERGKRGLDELHEQTVNLLSFHDLPRAVFDSQVAFNLISCYGAASQPALREVEDRIRRHFELITGGAVPVPSLMLAQAPIFHAHIFSLYIELEKPVGDGEFAEALSGRHVTIAPAGAAEEAPSNLSAAGQEQVQVAVRRDARNPSGMWLWAAADNLRIAALNAVECASSLALVRAGGTIQ